MMAGVQAFLLSAPLSFSKPASGALKSLITPSDNAWPSTSSSSLSVNCSTSHSAFPLDRTSSSTRSIDLAADRDDINSEASEPTTPFDTHSSPGFSRFAYDGASDDPSLSYTPLSIHQNPAISITPPIPLDTDVSSVRASTSAGQTTPPFLDQQCCSQIPLQGRPSSSRTIRRRISSFFGQKRRTLSATFNSSSGDLAAVRLSNTNMSETTLPGQPPAATNRPSQPVSTSTSRSITPSSTAINDQTPPPNKTLLQEPSREEFFGHNRKKNRSSTTLSITKKLFRHHDRSVDKSLTRHRATSVDLQQPSQPYATAKEEVKLTDRERLPWSLAAEAGTGVKARRMSLSLPDDFTVDVCPLHEEFSDQSMRFGKRGKTLGKGATSQVMLMTRKGFPTELYAVKEFRKKASNETAEDYEKKVKSEYSIAKSLHHPNIVETIRLCTHQGRWEHVMEWCSDGDLFSLVQKGYLKKGERMPDRLCLFKQLVQGVHYLHSNGIAHRDIKLENLLISNGSKLKITDFGVSEVFSGMHPGLRAAGGQCGQAMNNEIRLCAPGICGSMPYIAPEVLQKKAEYDPRPLDVWSTAIVMIHLIFGGAIWHRAESDKGECHYDDLVKGWSKWKSKHSEGESISETNYPHVKAFDAMVNPPALRRLLLGMLNPNPVDRLSMSEVANNRWMKHVECCQVDSFDDPAQYIDASKCNGGLTAKIKIAVHNHLPEKTKHNINHLIRLSND